MRLVRCSRRRCLVAHIFFSGLVAHLDLLLVVRIHRFGLLCQLSVQLCGPFGFFLMPEHDGGKVLLQELLIHGIIRRISRLGAALVQAEAGVKVVAVQPIITMPLETRHRVDQRHEFGTFPRRGNFKEWQRDCDDEAVASTRDRHGCRTSQLAGIEFAKAEQSFKVRLTVNRVDLPANSAHKCCLCVQNMKNESTRNRDNGPL